MTITLKFYERKHALEVAKALNVTAVGNEVEVPSDKIKQLKLRHNPGSTLNKAFEISTQTRMILILEKFYVAGLLCTIG